MSLDKNSNQDQPVFEELQFEEHLKQFHPIAPRTLLLVRRQNVASVRWPIFAATALIAVAIAMVITPQFSLRRGTASRQSSGSSPSAHAPLTFGQLNSAMRTGDQTLDNLLGAASPTLLPHEHRGTALYELSKE